MWWRFAGAFAGALVLLAVAAVASAASDQGGYRGASLWWGPTDEERVRVFAHTIWNASVLDVDAGDVGAVVPVPEGMLLDARLDGHGKSGPVWETEVDLAHKGWRMRYTALVDGDMHAELVDAQGGPGMPLDVPLTGHGGLGAAWGSPRWLELSLHVAARPGQDGGLVNGAGAPVVLQAAHFITYHRLEDRTQWPTDGAYQQAVPQRIDHPGVIRCPKEQVCTFDLGLAGQVVHFRNWYWQDGQRQGWGIPSTWATDDEPDPPPGDPRRLVWQEPLVQPGPPAADHEIVLDVNGTATWDTRGATLHADGPTYYAMEVLVRPWGPLDGGEEACAPCSAYGGPAGTEMDILIELVDPAPSPDSVWLDDVVPCGQRFTVPAGLRLVLPVAARGDGVDARLAPYVLPAGGVLHQDPPGPYVDGTVSWASFPAGLFAVAVDALPADLDETMDRCMFYVEGIGLHARMRHDVLGIGGTNVLLEDKTILHPDLHDPLYAWRVGEQVATGRLAAFSLPPGVHEACLTVTASLRTTSMMDTLCVPVHVGNAGADEDEDGVKDDADNCPGAPNRGQEDSDFDGVGDACEPQPPPARAGGPDQGGTDKDGDGFPDTLDVCPSQPDPLQEDTDVDRIGDLCDPDMDGDKVPQIGPGRLDNCPLYPNPDQRDADEDGVGDACDREPGGEDRPSAAVQGPASLHVAPRGADAPGADAPMRLLLAIAILFAGLAVALVAHFARKPW